MKRIFIWLFFIALITACTSATSSDSVDEPMKEEENDISLTETVTAEKSSQEIKISSDIDAILPLGTEVEMPDKLGIVMGDAVIIFRRSGGFAGVGEEWSIYPNGRIEGPDNVVKQVAPEQVQTLINTIQLAGFFDFNDSYIPLDNCCDRFTYSISVKVGDEVKTVSTIDDSPKQPEQLTIVINAISALLFESE